jgi:hypothetical protein
MKATNVRGEDLSIGRYQVRRLGDWLTLRRTPRSIWIAGFSSLVDLLLCGAALAYSLYQLSDLLSRMGLNPLLPSGLPHTAPANITSNHVIFSLLGLLSLFRGYRTFTEIAHLRREVENHVILDWQSGSLLRGDKAVCSLSEIQTVLILPLPGGAANGRRDAYFVFLATPDPPDICYYLADGDDREEVRAFAEAVAELLNITMREEKKPEGEKGVLDQPLFVLWRERRRLLTLDGWRGRWD